MPAKLTGQPTRGVDAAVRHAWQAGDASGAITVVLEAYGGEILGWLVGVLRNTDDAGDVFSAFCERLWATFSSFSWRCSIRTWAYTIARRVAIDHQRAEARRARRLVPLSVSPEVAQVAERVRTTTLPGLKTANRQAIAQLRDRLPPQDRMLLVLRVDRGLGWDDLARVFLERPEPTAAEVKREAARLRKRFQLIKQRLLQLGRSAGLVERP
ncbi:MAG TPA: RNA polymerase sigma factor [Kofleriaceae bacterium]